MHSPGDHPNLERIRALDFWQGPIELVPLIGGMTNSNYLVRASSGSFVARVCEPREILGIVRRNEVICQRAANELGVAPAVLFDEDGILVSEYVPATTMTAENVARPEFLPRLAEVLQVLHSGKDRLTGEMLYFSVFQTIRTYAGTARTLGASLPSGIDELIIDSRELGKHIRPFHPVLCHNDLLASNILDDGREISLVDWEYAGIGHPLFDLAGVSANCALSSSLEITFLAAYRGVVIADPVDLRELLILKAMSQLREALWSVIQTVVSEIDFDYQCYAENSFKSYREARNRLDPLL